MSRLPKFWYKNRGILPNMDNKQLLAVVKVINHWKFNHQYMITNNMVNFVCDLCLWLDVNIDQSNFQEDVDSLWDVLPTVEFVKSLQIVVVDVVIDVVNDPNIIT